MTSQQLLTIILIAIVANAVLIALALVTIRNSRARRAESGSVDITATHDRIVAMAGASSVTAARTVATAAGGTVAGGTVAADAGTLHVTSSAPAMAADDMEPANGVASPLEPATLDDPLAAIELDSPIAWRRKVDDEVVRAVRYHRPATVMIVELDGFERFTSRLGDAAGARILVATARTLSAQARAADTCAQFGRGRFAILLPETDDIKAINFAERVRSECDRWLDAGEISMRVAIGWALLDPAQGAGAAIEAAERRLDAVRRHRTGSAA